MAATLNQAQIKTIQQVQHELRTPLHGLLGLIEEIRSDIRAVGVTDRSQRSLLLQKTDTLGGLAERLQNVLDDFRDFAAESNSEPNDTDALKKETVDLGELLDSVAAESWSAQVRQIRADDGEGARLPPPPELILQTETSLRGWKTVLPADLMRKLAGKLIANALRFTREGYVEVSIAPGIDEIDEGNGACLEQRKLQPVSASQQRYINLIIEDTGEGMTERFVSHHLFEPFVKADDFKAGAGLSMVLCSSLVRRMGGSMHVSSAKGRGTVVTVKIPVETLPEPVEEGSSSSQSEQLVYLYGFEGYGLQRLAQVISAQLATYGNLYCTSHIKDADVLLLPEETCFDVQGGMDAILKSAKPGVKIGVLQAHEDAGVERAALRADSLPPTYVTRKPFGPRCFANLIRLAEQTEDHDTRNESETVREESGHLGYAAKQDPFNPNKTLHEEDAKPKSRQNSSNNRPPMASAKQLADLVISPDAMDTLLRAPRPMPQILPEGERRRHSVVSIETQSVEGGGAGIASAPLPTVPFSVLCCEDNPLNMRILTTMLRQSKIDFHEAVDGEQAVEQFKKHLPAVTLLDINMPKMMGFEACQLMRKHISDQSSGGADTRRMFKIVAVTALSDSFHKKKGAECGMDAWLTKPLQMRQLKLDLAAWKKEHDRSQESNSSHNGAWE